ncbi:MAG TPA: helix-turn-helix transcriptional regulator [Blastocatellia bacterium]|nr:helix-turn-helix transcriptional regulator [Blastocatellia bacterium]
MIFIKLNETLEKKGRTLYWLSQNSGIPYVTLWNLSKKESQSSINLPVLSRICSALDCLPGEILVYAADEEDEAIKSLVKSKLNKERQRREKGREL